MAIQNRRGAYVDLNPAKAVPGELLVVQSGDPNTTDGKAVYMTFASGDIKLLAMRSDVETAVADVAEDLLVELDNTISTFTETTAPGAVADVADEGAAQITAIGNKGDEVLGSIPSDYSTLSGDVSDLKSALEASEESITEKMIKVSSNNLLKSDSDYTQGSVYPSGQVNSASTLGYTDYIPVSEGDVVRYYGTGGGAFQDIGFRYICAYDSTKTPISASGAESAASYTVPSGIAYIRATFYFAYTTKMLTINYVATAYEPYFAPYYIAGEEFVEDVLNNYELPTETVKGYNLLPISENGSGYYYGSSVGSAVNFATSSTYHYAIVPVEKNTEYFVSKVARFWAFTDDNDIVTAYGENYGNIFNSGNATKFYYTVYNSDWNVESTYGSEYAMIISKGASGTYNNVRKPSFISGLTQNMMAETAGCSLPKRTVYFTADKEQTWYHNNILALDSNKLDFTIGSAPTEWQYVDSDIKIKFPNATTSTNGYFYRVYDAFLNCVSQKSRSGVKVYGNALQSCSVLVIGDSTVAQNTMTQKMMDAFTTEGETLTLLGTRGTSPNLHEGRAGWSAKQYCTESSSGGVANAFFNTATNKFDFSYYMTNQGYTSVDFIIIQLGINDLYNAKFENSENVISETAGYITEMIDSILAYNPNQKILLNLPTALNSDQSKQYHSLFLLRNMFIRYNEYIQFKTLNYPETKLRISNNHLLLDPATDILDDVHPTTTGYEKMATEVVSQINCWQNA